MDPRNLSGRELYSRTQQYTLQTHGAPDGELPPSTGRDDRQQGNVLSKIHGGVTYTRTQRYSLQTHGLPAEEPVPSTSGEDRRQATEAGEEQNVDAERRRKRMPEKRTCETQNNEPVRGAKKQKKAPTSSTAPVRPNEASPDELYLSALGTARSEEANPWLGRREPERTAPVAADYPGWSRPNVESSDTALSTEQMQRLLQHAAAIVGTRGSSLNLALGDCLDSFSGLDPRALYKVDYTPPVPARLTFTRVEPSPLPPPPLLHPYGLPEGSSQTRGYTRQPEVSNTIRPADTDEADRPNACRSVNTTGYSAHNPRTTCGRDEWPHGPNHCVPLPWIREHSLPIVKHLKDAETYTTSSQESQTDFEESSKCCQLIDAGRVVLHHNTPHNRGQTTVLEVDHLPRNPCGPSNSSTPNTAGNFRMPAPSGSARPPRLVRPPEVGSPNQLHSAADLQKTPNKPRRDISRERNSTGRDLLVTSVLNSPETTYSSYEDTLSHRD